VDISIESVDKVDDQYIHLGDCMVFDIVHRVGYEHLDDLDDVYIDMILNDILQKL
jgi:hypothetical protein